jgi:hypothetical protein
MIVLQFLPIISKIGKYNFYGTAVKMGKWLMIFTVYCSKVSVNFGNIGKNVLIK